MPSFVAIIAVVWVEKPNQKWADLTVSYFACCQLTINCSSHWLSGTSYIIQVRDLHVAVSSHRSSLNINVLVKHFYQPFTNSVFIAFKLILFNVISYLIRSKKNGTLTSFFFFFNIIQIFSGIHHSLNSTSCFPGFYFHLKIGESLV